MWHRARVRTNSVRQGSVDIWSGVQPVMFGGPAEPRGWKSNGQFKGLEIQKQSELCGEGILRNLIWLHQDGRCL